jgi:uncharacterized protein (UPF0248 family)
MKYSDVSSGMLVSFDFENIDLGRWEKYGAKYIRNPNYTDAQGWYNRILKSAEGKPLKIVDTHISRTEGESFAAADQSKYPPHRVITARKPDGKTVEIWEFWFDPKNENAFKRVTLSEPEVKPTSPPEPEVKPTSQPEPASGTGINAIRSLKAQNQGGRKTRKGRKSKKTRRTRKH